MDKLLGYVDGAPFCNTFVKLFLRTNNVSTTIGLDPDMITSTEDKPVHSHYTLAAKDGTMSTWTSRAVKREKRNPGERWRKICQSNSTGCW